MAELLREGSQVITTVHIQLLESLYDEVERVTGVKVKERLPDSVVGEADQIIHVVLSTEDLLERMKAGQIYPRERAERALEHFFTPGNLIRRREPTLAEMVHLIGRRGRRAAADRSPSATAERVMVGLSSLSPDGPALLRKGARLADRHKSPCYAVSVQAPAEDAAGADAATRKLLGANLELARQLGGIPMTFRGQDVPRTISACAPEHGTRVLVVGKTRQPWPRRLFGTSLLERLFKGLNGADVLIVDVRADRHSSASGRGDCVASAGTASGRSPSPRKNRAKRNRRLAI